jgi:hypothetical protein
MLSKVFVKPVGVILPPSMNLTTISLVALKICSSIDAICSYLLLLKILNIFQNICALSRVIPAVNCSARPNISFMSQKDFIKVMRYILV